MIRIVGLGAGDINQLPLGIYRLLKDSKVVYARTVQHPVVEVLHAEGVNFVGFDAVYEKHKQFDAVYAEIVEILQEKAAEANEIVYAVPGHPMIAERTVQLLLESDTEVEIVGGQSFIDALITAVKIDPIEGFQLLDATALRKHEIQITQHVIIGQIYDQFVASEVKLSLLEKYPADHAISIVTNAGMADQQVNTVPLYELDHDWHLSNLTSIYVPPSTMLSREFWHLREIFATLRGPEGCPWDKEQTHATLTNKLLEETQEYVEAVEKQDIDNMVEELGDILLHIMLNAQIGEDDGYFTIDDVIQAITDKMIRRHPHVFGDLKAETAEEALALFQEAKRAEKDRD